MILTVGLTGGIGSGKSTVMRTLAGLGCITVDADALVAELYRPGNAGHDAIVRTYGPSVLASNGEIDRKKLSSVAFSSAEEARRLNALIHPLVIAEQARIARAEVERAPGQDLIFVVEATLLLESGGKQRYDRIVVVDVASEVQLTRAVGRGMEAEEVARRMTNQMPREERLRQADYVIDNSGDARAAEAETARVYDLLALDLADKKKPRA